MASVLELVFPYFAIILIGFISGRWQPLGQDALGWMNRFVIYVALPALFFSMIARTPLEDFANGRYVLATTLGTLTVYLLSLVIGLTVGKSTWQQSIIQGFCGAYGNIGYMGIGLCLSLWGHEAAVPIALVFCFDNTLHFVMAPLLMSLASSKGLSAPRVALLVTRKVFLHPFILATLAGLLAAALGNPIPPLVNGLLTRLSDTAAPSALFILGVTLALTKIERWTHELSLHLFIKLILHPLIMLAMLTLFGGFPPVWTSVAVLMASLPVALNVFVLAEQYGAYTVRSSAIILVSTCLSVLTVPLIIRLLSQQAPIQSLPL